MIATVGYDGFLYSIGYLAGWIVALFVVAEPLIRLGKYTFADALDSKFGSKGIRLAAAPKGDVCVIIRQSCRCEARSSMLTNREKTRCWRTKKFKA